VRRLDQIVGLLALALKRDMETQTEAVVAFAQAGLEPAEIAQLLDTTPATVRSTLSKADKKSK
jgi:DNA-directed RNA polymerase specialized sigma24 family protein